LDWTGAAWVLTATNFGRSERASVALKLPGAMQLVQVPMIVGASYLA